MMMNKRNVLVVLGVLIAVGGAALGTGAFSSVQAERDVTVSIADDSNAFLSMEVHSDHSDTGFVEESGGTIGFDFADGNSASGDGLNRNATTQFDNLITVTNNGTSSVTLDITAENGAGTEVTNGFTAYNGTDPSDQITSVTLEADESVDVGFEFDTTANQNLDSIETIVISAEDS